MLFTGGEQCPERWTYLCKGPGVGSSRGRSQTGQEAVELEPGLAQENGCLSGPRHLHDGPRPEGERGAITFSGNQRCDSVSGGGKQDLMEEALAFEKQNSQTHFTRGR